MIQNVVEPRKGLFHFFVLDPRIRGDDIVTPSRVHTTTARQIRSRPWVLE